MLNKTMMAFYFVFSVTACFIISLMTTNYNSRINYIFDHKIYSTIYVKEDNIIANKHFKKYTITDHPSAMFSISQKNNEHVLVITYVDDNITVSDSLPIKDCYIHSIDDDECIITMQSYDTYDKHGYLKESETKYNLYVTKHIYKKFESVLHNLNGNGQKESETYEI